MGPDLEDGDGEHTAGGRRRVAGAVLYSIRTATTFARALTGLVLL